MQLKKFTVSIILVLSSLLSLAQFKADSVFIYRDFNFSGTSAMLSYNHNVLDSLNSPKIRMSTIDLTELKALFENENESKYFQQKHGAEIFYLTAWLNNKRFCCVVEISEEFCRIINLTDMKQWKLKDSEKTKN